MKAADGSATPVDTACWTVASVLFDAVYVAGGGERRKRSQASADALAFHGRGVSSTARRSPRPAPVSRSCGASYLGAKGAIDPNRDADTVSSKDGVVTGGDRQGSKVASAFVEAIAQHRFWVRETADRVRA